jgi:protein TonB
MKLLWNLIAVTALFGAVASAQDAPKKITKSEALSALATKVQPVYPSVARQLKIQGTVELEAEVAENGTVSKVNIVSGNPVLTNSAAMAVKGWKFKPFIEDGKPIRVLAPISMEFKL